MPTKNQNRTMENVDIAFRNFAGKEDVYNRAGDMNFAIMLEPEVATEMIEEGWNVKFLKERDEGDGQQAYIQVAVSYKTRPPKIALVTSKGISYLGQDEVEMLDWVDIAEADVTINPYQWAVGDKSGTKAYLQSLFIRIHEDYLQDKWTNWVDEQKQIGPARNDYIDGEVVTQQYEIEGAR